jgi:hypothetical protein
VSKSKLRESILKALAKHTLRKPGHVLKSYSDTYNSLFSSFKARLYFLCLVSKYKSYFSFNLKKFNIILSIFGLYMELRV